MVDYFDVLNAKMKEYKSFMVKAGLYGNTMSYHYRRHLMLATSNTWFKNMLELTSYFNFWLNFNGDFHLKPSDGAINL
jgi:hypothetical protein